MSWKEGEQTSFFTFMQ